MNDVRVAAVQFESLQGDKRANLEKIRWFAEQAAQRGVQMVVFPECCITGYWFLRKLSRDELSNLAEPVFTGPSSLALADLASRHGMTIGAGLVETGEDGWCYNSSSTVCDAKCLQLVDSMRSGALQRQILVSRLIAEYR